MGDAEKPATGSVRIAGTTDMSVKPMTRNVFAELDKDDGKLDRDEVLALAAAVMLSFYVAGLALLTAVDMRLLPWVAVSVALAVILSVIGRGLGKDLGKDWARLSIIGRGLPWAVGKGLVKGLTVRVSAHSKGIRRRAELVRVASYAIRSIRHAPYDIRSCEGDFPI
jgi:hypothetical protein